MSRQPVPWPAMIGVFVTLLLAGFAGAVQYGRQQQQLSDALRRVESLEQFRDFMYGPESKGWIK